VTERLFHLALADDWAAAFETGEYRASTIGLTLDEVGFIHLSHEHQVRFVADAFYRGRPDVVLLVIDPARAGVGARVREEPGVPGGDELFPHLYGALPVAAVVAAPAVGLGEDGRLDLGALLSP
jgi:glutathione S-transferase